MITEQEHEIVAAIRGWLAATSDLEVPTGLSRDEARRRARELLATIATGRAVPDDSPEEDGLMDILWAAVGELNERPIDGLTFQACDLFYQFVAALPAENDPFGERDEVLHRVARIGWCSAPGGLGVVIEARAAIWEHGDEKRHRDVCDAAGQLRTWIDSANDRAVNIAELREICAHLVKLAGVAPQLTAASVPAFDTVISRCRACHLDDREFLRAAAAFAGGMADRLLGKWRSAESGYSAAAAGFRRCAATSDLDRVIVERLAVLYSRGDHQEVAASARLIERMSISRESVKARAILASALAECGRPTEAKSLLEELLQDPAIGREAALSSFALMKLGSTLADLGKHSEAVARFQSAAAILERFHYPALWANLVSSIGESLGRRGNLTDAALLYRAARGVYVQVGLASYTGYLTVLLAEVLMLLGRNAEAEAELLGALPLIEKFDLRRESVAAVALLREAMTKNRTDVKMIQELRDQLRKG